MKSLQLTLFKVLSSAEVVICEKVFSIPKCEIIKLPIKGRRSMVIEAPVSATNGGYIRVT